MKLKPFSFKEFMEFVVKLFVHQIFMEPCVPFNVWRVTIVKVVTGRVTRLVNVYVKQIGSVQIAMQRLYHPWSIPNVQIIFWITVDAITVVLVAIKDVVVHLDSLANIVKRKWIIALIMDAPIMQRVSMGSIRTAARVQLVLLGNFVKLL